MKNLRIHYLSLIVNIVMEIAREKMKVRKLCTDDVNDSSNFCLAHGCSPFLSIIQPCLRWDIIHNHVNLQALMKAQSHPTFVAEEIFFIQFLKRKNLRKIKLRENFLSARVIQVNTSLFFAA